MLEEIVFKGRETCWEGESGGEKQKKIRFEENSSFTAPENMYW